MQRDFTVGVYRQFLEAALKANFELMPFLDYVEGREKESKVMILRHDVDRKPENALRIARLQSELGVRGTYYFRSVPVSYSPTVMTAVSDLGHEIGYHYEDLALCFGDPEEAISQFERNLARFRKLYPVKTICMHGSPLSRWDNKALWQRYDYRDFGLVAEPFFDLNFDHVLYLTDTGRTWGGIKVSVRDKVGNVPQHKFKTTADIITGFENGTLRGHIMQNIHPHRWTDTFGEWMGELALQGTKNLLKRQLIRYRQ